MNLESAIVLENEGGCFYFKGTRSKQAVVNAMKRHKCKGYILLRKIRDSGYYAEILQRPWDGELINGATICIMDDTISKN